MDKCLPAGRMGAETKFQGKLLLSILRETKGYVTLFELGAGWGRLCLTLAGIVDNGIMPFDGYRCLAVEAEPTHYQWAREHFKSQDIKAELVHGAVSDKDGWCFFHSHLDPRVHYGQEINQLFNHGIPSPHNIMNVLTGKTSVVRTHTVDILMYKYGFEWLDILQMDIQGAEYKALKGAMCGIKSGKIKNILINVHSDKLGFEIKDLLYPYMQLVWDSPRGYRGYNDGYQVWSKNG